jgi:hypothetical protein
MSVESRREGNYEVRTTHDRIVDRDDVIRVVRSDTADRVVTVRFEPGTGNVVVDLERLGVSRLLELARGERSGGSGIGRRAGLGLFRRVPESRS